MSDLYPLLLKPEFRERIWGTRDLSPLYGPAPGEAPIGEVWLTGDDNQVANGALAGMSLGELCRRYGRDLVGETAPDADRFPLLVKFLFPRDKLSVQVHPDDETARRSGLPCGKTECWYVFQAEAGAKIGLGLKPGTTREEFARAIEEVRAERLLNWIDVRAGEIIYVDAGTVHTIGPGVILLETQQNSDTTYRLYDYGRPRQLHVQQGLAALKEVTNAGKMPPPGDDRSAILIDSPYFTVFRHRLRKPHTPEDGLHWGESNTSPKLSSRTHVLVAVEGCGIVQADNFDSGALCRGDAVVIPATVREFDVLAQWELDLLMMTVPPRKASTQVTADSSRTKVRSE
jgi:mannose-6-phosphate isomerase